MSKKYVRDTVRSWLPASGSGSPIPFYETVNVDQDPTDNSWYTIEFNPEVSDEITFCRAKSETGVIDFVFNILPGQGDSQLLGDAQTIVDAFMLNKDPTYKLTLTNQQAPEEFSGGSANKYYQIIIGVEYSYFY